MRTRQACHMVLSLCHDVELEILESSRSRSRRNESSSRSLWILSLCLCQDAELEILKSSRSRLSCRDESSSRSRQALVFIGTLRAQDPEQLEMRDLSLPVRRAYEISASPRSRCCRDVWSSRSWQARARDFAATFSLNQLLTLL